MPQYTLTFVHYVWFIQTILIHSPFIRRRRVHVSVCVCVCYTLWIAQFGSFFIFPFGVPRMNNTNVAHILKMLDFVRQALITQKPHTRIRPLYAFFGHCACAVLYIVVPFVNETLMESGRRVRKSNWKRPEIWIARFWYVLAFDACVRVCVWPWHTCICIPYTLCT